MGRPFGTRQSDETRRKIGIASRRIWKEQKACGILNRGAGSALKAFYASSEGIDVKLGIARKVQKSWLNRSLTNRRCKRMSEAKKGIVWSKEAIRARTEGIRRCYAEGRHPGGGPNGWHRQVYKGVIFSSSYEVKFAKWLDRNGVYWKYQLYRFDLGPLGTYRPDFYLVDYDWWIEIKGAMLSLPMKKFFAFKGMFPNTWLLDRDTLVEVGILEN